MARIEYILSFENYLEMTSSHREQKDFRIPVIVAITGFVCIAAGYLFLKLNIEGSFFPGGFLLASGLLLAFLAAVLGFLAKPKSSRPDTAVLRREYETYHADNRAIDFDENGWRVFWYEGEDVRPWTCLRQLHELKTLLILGTGTTFYWIPKSALQRDGLFDQLKAQAESVLTNRELLFKVPLRLSAIMYTAAAIFHNWRRQPLPRLIGVAAFTLMTYWLFYAANGQSEHSAWYLLGAPLLLSVGEAVYYLSTYRAKDWSNVSETAEIMSDCMGCYTSTVRWIVDYRRIVEVKEIFGAFLLYYDADTYHLIPKRGFSSSQIAQFRDLIARAGR